MTYIPPAAGSAPPDGSVSLTKFASDAVSALNGKAAASHTHDDRYFTEAEATALLSGKSDTGHAHSIANVTGLQAALDGKASVSQVGPWTTVKATADETKTNNSLTASTQLTVSLAAATRYTIRGVAYLLVQNANEDARYDLNYSGTWTTVYCRDTRNVAGVAAGTDARTDRIASALPGSTDVLATVTGLVVVEFELTGLTNASGTFAVRFAQVTTGASGTLLKAGSYLEYMTV